MLLKEATAFLARSLPRYASGLEVQDTTLCNRVGSWLPKTPVSHFNRCSSPRRTSY